MDKRSTIWNRVNVPYGASVKTLAQLVAGQPPARWAAFMALAHTSGEAALAVLRENAQSHDPHVRRSAIEAIGVHRDGYQLVEVISEALSDEYPFVVRAACEAAGRHRLVRLHDAVLRLVGADLESTRVAALRAVRWLWHESDFDPVLAVSTSDPSLHVKKEAAWTLHSIASESNWRPLFEVWRSDPIPRHRKWACDLASAYGNASLLSEVRTLIADPDGHVRRRASRTIHVLEGRLDS